MEYPELRYGLHTATHTATATAAATASFYLQIPQPQLGVWLQDTRSVVFEKLKGFQKSIFGGVNEHLLGDYLHDHQAEDFCFFFFGAFKGSTSRAESLAGTSYPGTPWTFTKWFSLPSISLYCPQRLNAFVIWAWQLVV